jgi:acyl-CoA thioester hydrolase
MSSNPHQTPIRVYFEDTDSGGIVYYANYFKYAERARTELLRFLGIESQRMMREFGIGLAVRCCHAEYLKPAVLDDRVVVQTELQKVGGASIKLQQVIIRGGDELVQIGVKLGCINFASGRPVALPEYLRNALNTHMNSTKKMITI